MADITGIIDGTIGPIISSAAGYDSPTGTSAGTMGAFGCASNGLVIAEIEGTSEGTFGPITGNAYGGGGTVGVGAGTFGPMRGGSSVADYNITIKTRPIYVGPDESSISEAIDCTAYCEFRDTKDLHVTLTSDIYRQYSGAEYNSNDTIENNQSSVGQPYFRHHVQIVPAEGLFGSMFQLEVEKHCPINGDFKYFGFDMHVAARPQIGPEFKMASGTLNNAWPT